MAAASANAHGRGNSTARSVVGATACACMFPRAQCRARSTEGETAFGLGDTPPPRRESREGTASRRRTAADSPPRAERRESGGNRPPRERAGAPGGPETRKRKARRARRKSKPNTGRTEFESCSFGLSPPGIMPCGAGNCASARILAEAQRVQELPSGSVAVTGELRARVLGPVVDGRSEEDRAPLRHRDSDRSVCRKRGDAQELRRGRLGKEIRGKAFRRGSDERSRASQIVNAAVAPSPSVRTPRLKR